MSSATATSTSVHNSQHTNHTNHTNHTTAPTTHTNHTAITILNAKGEKDGALQQALPWAG